MMSGRLKDTPRSESAAIVATGAAFFMIVLDTSIVNLALPRIKDVFHADLTALQWLVDGYALVFASLLLNAGVLGDRYGAKRMFSAGLLIFCAASAACGLAPNMAILQCARAIQGIGAALLLPNSLAALNHTVQDPERRKIAVSAWSSAGALGVAVGPLVGGVLVQYLDWRSIFLVNIPVGLCRADPQISASQIRVVHANNPDQRLRHQIGLDAVIGELKSLMSHKDS
jgi:MFS transporter, DHA2 family, methylenomycin A resistance protein